MICFILLSFMYILINLEYVLFNMYIFVCFLLIQAASMGEENEVEGTRVFVNSFKWNWQRKTLCGFIADGSQRKYFHSPLHPFISPLPHPAMNIIITNFKDKQAEQITALSEQLETVKLEKEVRLRVLFENPQLPWIFTCSIHLQS